MIAETKSFMCINSACQHDNTQRHAIIQYEHDKGEAIQCPHCNSLYIEHESEILFVATDNDSEVLSIDSAEAFQSFDSDYSSVRKYIPQLIIKDINEPDFNSSIISFSKCLIGELIIENVNITSAFYPISFSDCTIEQISIKNSNIKRAGIKDYYSSWSIYGIHFYNTRVNHAFNIDNLQTRMMFSACQIKCMLNLSNNSVIEMAWMHNADDPLVQYDNSSSITQQYTVKGLGAGKGRKISTEGKVIKELKIDELTVDPSMSENTLIEDCSIRQINMPEGSNVKGGLIFRNCYIESVKQNPHFFEKDIVFEGCTFNEELAIVRSGFRQSLVMEACLFHGRVIINDLIIEKDLHISFSRFNKDLQISLVELGGFITAHFVLADSGFRFESTDIKKDINLRNIKIHNDLILSKCNVSGNLFIKRAGIDGRAEINWLNTGELNMEDVVVKGETAIESSSIREDFRLSTSKLEQVFGMLFMNVLGKTIFLKNAFMNDFTMDFCETRINLFTDNDYRGIFRLSSSNISNQSRILNSLFRTDCYLNAIKSGDFFFDYNYVIEDLEIDDSRLGNIDLEENLLGRRNEINNTTANVLRIEHSSINDLFSIYSSELNDIKILNNNCKGSTKITFSSANDLSVSENMIDHSLEMSNLRVNDIFIFNNEIAERRNKPATLKKEEADKPDNGLFVKQIYANDVNINDNKLYHSCECTAAEVNNLKLFDNYFSDGIEINATEADAMIFGHNLTPLLGMSNGKYTKISISDCDQLGKLKLNNVETEKDISISNNIIHYGAELLFCKIDNDLDADNNTFKQAMDIQHCKLGNSINLKQNIYLSDFYLNKNTVYGSIDLDDKYINKEVYVRNNNINGNLSWANTEFRASFTITENSVGQMFCISNLNFIYGRAEPIPISERVDTSDPIIFPRIQPILYASPTLTNNKFNNVNFDKSYFNTVLIFDQNVVSGNLSWGQKDSSRGYSGIVFEHPISFTENKIRTVEFNNLLFKSAACLQNNHIEAGFTLYDTDFETNMDFSGSFVGGSFTFYKVNKQDDGDLILDNTFIDKRIRFIQTNPRSFSFINANFNNFEIPSEWRLRWGNLLTTSRESKSSQKKEDENSGQKKSRYLFKETIIHKGKEDVELPYSLINSYCGSIDIFEDIPRIWTKLQWEFFPKEEIIDLLNNEIIGGYSLLKHRALISRCIEKEFLPVYYNLIDHKDIEDLLSLSMHFASEENNYESEEARYLVGGLKTFFYAFFYALRFNYLRKISWDNENDKEYGSNLENAINRGLQEQYQVLRQIYGDNGELSNEDKAFYRWMHYHNISDMREGSFWTKALSTGKYIVFEKIFGWGVNLFRIVGSTMVMVLLFGFIYYLMFSFMPGSEISWDGKPLTGAEIGGIKPFVFALQTTFSAVLGDWAPIGSGIIKIPMTINAILGVLFVTFLIGAYGRKMLR